MTINEIKKRYEDWCVRLEAVKLCQSRDDVPLSLIERFYEDRDCDVRLEAVKLCQSRDDVPLSLIERFYEDRDCDVRQEAIKLYQNRDDVPLSLIERFYEDRDCDVRQEAIKKRRSFFTCPKLHEKLQILFPIAHIVKQSSTFRHYILNGS